MATDLGICSQVQIIVFWYLEHVTHFCFILQNRSFIFEWLGILEFMFRWFFFYIFCLGRVVSFECCFWYKESKCTIPRWRNVSCFIKDDFDVSQLINFWDIFLIINIWFELAVWEIISTLWPFSILGMYKLIHCQVNSMIFCFVSIRQVKPFSTDC